MSSRDFQLAFAKLISSPRLCVSALEDEEAFFAGYDLSDKEKRRINTVLRQKGISACCSLYRMNRVTPVYLQLSNTASLLGDDLIPLVEEFWQYLSAPSLQFREEVLEFGHFLMRKIEQGLFPIPYLQEVLQLEIAMNELSYLPEGECRVIQFQHDILLVLQALADGRLASETIPPDTHVYRLYMQKGEIKMDII